MEKAEYIEREKLDKWLLTELASLDGEEDRKFVVERLRTEILTADVVPVRHGRWIVSRTDYGWNSAEFPTHCKCDQCGREVPYQDRDNYCPNCGARMDKDGDGDV